MSFALSETVKPFRLGIHQYLLRTPFVSVSSSS